MASKPTATPTSTTDGFLSDPYLKEIPTKRAAYSDRMAVLMAWMSGLAYTEFENPGKSEEAMNGYIDDIIARIKPDGPGTNLRDVIRHLIENPPNPSAQHDRDDLEADLKQADFKLVNTYDIGAQQAFLAKRNTKPSGSNEEEKIVVLSFRGTERTKFKDWAVNVQATKKKLDGNVIVHSGYWNAFRDMESRLKDDLSPLRQDGYTLYITGHSMGGGMALIATRQLAEDSTGACYTFGAPRVGGYGFADKIKTPIYRLVNANDIVPRLPPAHVAQVLRFALALIPIPYKGLIDKILEKYTGYVHHGDMRYLRRATERPGGMFDEIKLLSNPNMVHRFGWFIKGWFKDPKSPLNDHKIAQYKGKLKQRALDRRI